MIEIWKDIDGYEGAYQVSNLGRIKSYKFKESKILKCGDNGKGYLLVNLSLNNKVARYYVHRLVAQAFIYNPNKLNEINHKDENKSNNQFNNLEWCTHEFNMNHGTLSKRMHENRIGKKASIESRQKMSKTRKGKNKGSDNSYAKRIICLNTKVVYNTLTEAKEKMNTCVSSLSLCCKGILKSAGKHPETGEKLKWMYYEEYLKLQESV